MKWTIPLAFCALSGAAVVSGCKGGGEIHIGTPPPPPPPPPPPDQDGDGIADPDDKCPTEKEDGNPPDPKDGCPNKDMDKDGIPVPEDKCPDQPETVNGFEDEDGCPDQKPLVQLKATEVQINQKIQFEKDKADIHKDSMVVIDAVAKLLEKNPELQLLEVGGHASKEGSDAHNKTLTQKRVDAVAAALVKAGISKDRLVAQGYGAYCPLDPGTTPEAFEKNRRVEFKILYRKGKDLGQKRGCEEALKKGVKLKKLPPLKPYTESEGKPGEAGKAPAGTEPAKAPESGAPAPGGSAAPATSAAPASSAKAPAPSAAPATSAAPAPSAAPAK